jgi:hypothetical protein
VHNDPRLSDEEARRLWQRAAELQADASRVLEERSKDLARREDGDDQDGYSVEHVRQAAVEAGISSEFVELALEERTEGVGGEPTRFQRVILGKERAPLLARRTYEHPAAEVFAAMQRVLPALALNLVDTRGGDPLEGGWMHFELRSSGFNQTDKITFDLYQWADVRELHVRLVSLGDERCEVTIRAPMDYARKLTSRVFAAIAPVGGGLLAAISGGVLAAVTGGLALAPLAGSLMLAAGTVGAFGAGTVGSLAGLRRLAKSGSRKGQSALERILASFETDVRTGGAFRISGGPPQGGSPPSLPGPPIV